MLLHFGCCVVLFIFCCPSIAQNEDPVDVRFLFDGRTVTVGIGPLAFTFGGKGNWLLDLIPTIGLHSIPELPTPSPLRPERSVPENSINDTQVSERFLFEICDAVIGLLFHKHSLRDAMKSAGHLGKFKHQQAGQQAVLNDHLQQAGQQAIVNLAQQAGQQAIVNLAQQAGQQAVLNDHLQQAGQQAIVNLAQQAGQQAVLNDHLQQAGQQAVLNDNLQQAGQQATVNLAQQAGQQAVLNDHLQQAGQQAIVDSLQKAGQEAIFAALHQTGDQQLFGGPTKILVVKDAACKLCNEPVQVLPNPASLITVVEFLEHDTSALHLLKEFLQSQKYFLPYESTPFPGYATYLEFLDAYILRALSLPLVMDNPALATALTELKKKIPRDSLIGPLTM